MNMLLSEFLEVLKLSVCHLKKIKKIKSEELPWYIDLSQRFKSYFAISTFLCDAKVFSRVTFSSGVRKSFQARSSMIISSSSGINQVFNFSINSLLVSCPS